MAEKMGGQEVTRGFFQSMRRGSREREGIPASSRFGAVPVRQKFIPKIGGTLRFAQIVLTAVSWIVTIFLTLMIVVDVSGRYFLNRPLPATWEIGEICMPYIIFLPFAYTLSRDNHVRVLLIKNRLSKTLQRRLKYFTDGISLVICALMTYYAWLRFWESYTLREEMMAAVEILWWWGKIAMPIGMGMFTIAYFWEFIEPTGGGPQGKH
jgi:TRAP-type C4-dicarboxylate transport system permease small subunit